MTDHQDRRIAPLERRVADRMVQDQRQAKFAAHQAEDRAAIAAAAFWGSVSQDADPQRDAALNVAASKWRTESTPPREALAFTDGFHAGWDARGVAA